MKRLILILVLFCSPALADKLADDAAVCEAHHNTSLNKKHIAPGYKSGYEGCIEVMAQFNARVSDKIDAQRDAAAGVDQSRLRSLLKGKQP